MRQPCAKDCPRRGPGCGTSCPDWAAWVKFKAERQRQKLKQTVADRYYADRNRKAR